MSSLLVYLSLSHVLFRAIMGKLTIAQRDEIVKWRLRGLTYREISKRVDRPVSTVAYTIRKYERSKTTQELYRSGRKRALTKSKIRYVVINSLRDRRKTIAILTEEVNLSRKNNPVSQSTVRRALIENSLKGCVAARKPLLRPQNVKKRLNFCRAHRHWTKEDWRKVFYTDESKFELFGTKRRIFVRRSPHERFHRSCLLPTIKHGDGSIMVWGAISANGVGPLRRVEGIMVKET